MTTLKFFAGWLALGGLYGLYGNHNLEPFIKRTVEYFGAG